MSFFYQNVVLKSFIFSRLISLFIVVIALAACGGGGGGAEQNTSFSALAGQDQTVSEGATVQLSGSSSGASGTLTYSWIQINGANVTLSNVTIINPVFEAPQVATGSSEVLTFEFSVTNPAGTIVTDSVDITVNNVVGNLPIANAGADQSVNSVTNVALSGAASGNNPPFTYNWLQTAGTSVTLSDVSIANPSFTAPLVASGANEILSFELTVTDASGNMDTDQVSITVTGAVTVQTRINRVEYDYDNNGTSDAISLLTYDELGRLILNEHIYTDDGTADLLVVIKETAVTNEITYDANGRVASNYRLDDDQGGNEFIYTYDPGTGLLTRTDVVTSDLSGNTTSEAYVLYTYSGNDVISYSIYLSSNDMLLLTSDFTYDANGRIIQEDGSSAVAAARFIKRYTWDNNGRLEFYEEDKTADGVFEVTHDYVFDGVTGLLIERIKNDTGPFADPDDTRTESYIYDTNNRLESVEYDKDHDGTIDAISFVAEREAGLCLAEYIPFLIPSVGQDGIPGSNVGDLGWCQ